MGCVKMNLALGFFGTLMLLHGAILTTEAAVQYYDFMLQESSFTRLCSTKNMVTVNGSFPGPTITARRGDTIFVNVHNQGTLGFTLHWHGVKQPRNSWSDGPENITQCPIMPGNSFQYEIDLSDEEGTLWWHAHSHWSRATAHGAIVVLPALGTTYPFPTPRAQQTIILGSWFNDDPNEIIKDALATGTDPDISNAYTINGQPGDLYPCSNGSTFRIQVEFGKMYLLRLINAVMNEEQFFAIANHALTVVGMDAAYVKPITTNYVMITPGQTIDILVAANQKPGYYYIASTPFSDSAMAPYDSSTTTGIFQYNNVGIPSAIPLPTLPNATDDFAASNFTKRLKSLPTRSHPINVPKTINQNIVVTIGANLMPCTNNACVGNSFRLTASLNNVSFVTQKVSILEAYYRNLAGVYQDNFPNNPPDIFDFTGDTSNVSLVTNYGTRAKVLNYGDAVELVFQGTNLLSAGNHPMHVHGYSFYVVGQGTGNFNTTTDPKSYNLFDPPLVNTFGVPKNGWMAVRFVADNPGVWFIHCHLEKHASWGMETVLIVKNGNTLSQSIRPPPPNMPACS